MEDVQPEIEYWGTTVVCYILGIKPPFRIVDGFIRRVWRVFGVHKVVMMDNGVFIVKFRSNEKKRRLLV